MMKVDAQAPAKVNLTLHVTGRRPDGYHELDSLVVFADICDQLTITAAPGLQLTVNGPFSTGVPTDERNIVLRAASALREARGVRTGAAIALEKHLPNAAGLGGGSSDAAAALKALSQFWEVDPLPDGSPDLTTLGADVPVCLRAPAPTRMTGIGDVLTATPRLPAFALVLVNPKVDVPTAEVFDGLTSTSNPPMSAIPKTDDLATFVDWVSSQRNDLLSPARRIAPAIDQAIARLSAMPKVLHAGMSGSGATCFGIVPNMADARQVARAIQVSEMSWWVAPAQMLR